MGDGGGRWALDAGAPPLRKLRSEEEGGPRSPMNKSRIGRMPEATAADMLREAPFRQDLGTC